MNSSTDPTTLWPLVAYFGIVVFVASSMIGLSYVLGQRHQERATGEPYESGIVSSGSARLRFDVRFYLTAIFFLIFDVEAVFIFAWAVAARESGWPGYFEVLIFIVILLAALAYLWRLGALDWTSTRRSLAARRPGSGKTELTKCDGH